MFVSRPTKQLKNYTVVSRQFKATMPQVPHSSTKDARAASGKESEEEPAPWKEKDVYHTPASGLVITESQMFTVCKLSLHSYAPCNWFSHTDLSHTR